MYRQEFIDNIEDVSDFLNFCFDNNYDGHAECIYSDEARDEYINDWLSETVGYDAWYDIKDTLNSLADQGTYDYWRRDDYGDWVGIDDSEFEYMKNELLEYLDNDGFFEDGSEDEDNDGEEQCRLLDVEDPFTEEDPLEPGDFGGILSSMQGVPQYDTVVAMNLAKLRAAHDASVKADEEFRKIVEESNRLTAGDLSAVLR